MAHDSLNSPIFPLPKFSCVQYNIMILIINDALNYDFIVDSVVYINFSDCTPTACTI